MGFQWSLPYLVPYITPEMVAAWRALAAEQQRKAVAQAAERMRKAAAGVFFPGDGLKIVGHPNAVARYNRILKRAMARSPTFHKLMLDINADKDHPVTVTLAWNEKGVYIDTFDSKKFAPGHQNLDMADYAELPATPPDDHPNAITQDEALVHAMAEARAGSHGNGYEQAHQFGITAQNVYRDERNQAGHRKPAPDDGGFDERGVWQMEYDNGYSEEVDPEERRQKEHRQDRPV